MKKEWYFDPDANGKRGFVRKIQGRTADDQELYGILLTIRTPWIIHWFDSKYPPCLWDTFVGDGNLDKNHVPDSARIPANWIVG